MDTKQLWPGWKIVRPIGAGGCGIVYEICKEDSSGEYRSALKVITIPSAPDEYDSYKDDGYDDESITAIFKSQVNDLVLEYQMMSQFKGTSNIVCYEDHMIIPHEDEKGWDILIRMELLTSLPHYYNTKALTEEEVIKIGIDICRALELCNQKHIVHRDIKPQNIFVNEFGNFKLGDFGIAKTMEHATNATRIGTYGYMAPEVYKNLPYNYLADMYSLGLVLYWLLNDRRLPFMPQFPTIPSAADNTNSQTRRLNGEIIPAPKNGSEALKTIVLKACAYRPEDRYQSFTELRQALETVNAPKVVLHTAPLYEVAAPTETPAMALQHEVSVREAVKKTTPPRTPGGNTSENTAPANRNINCPYCNKGTAKVFHRTNQDAYWASEESCSVCNGTGKLSGASASAIVREFTLLTQQEAYKKANRSCTSCGGIGFTRYAKAKGRLRACPKCTGKTVIPAPVKPKKRWVAMLLSIFPYTGLFGINRIYEGNWPMFVFTFVPGFLVGGWFYSMIESFFLPKEYYPTNLFNDTSLPAGESIKLP